MVFLIGVTTWQLGDFGQLEQISNSLEFLERMANTIVNFPSETCKTLANVQIVPSRCKIFAILSRNPNDLEIC